MIRIAICDDLKSDRDALIKLIHNYFIVHPKDYTIQEYASASNLLADYEDNIRYDILYLDIFMKPLDGMNCAYKLREIDQHAGIIFTTTSTDFAIESYHVQAAGYLVKPINRNLFADQLTHFLHNHEQNEKRLIIKVRGNLEVIPYHQIVYIESQNTNILVHTLDSRTLRTYGKLGDMEENLKNKRFLRCHQSFIVNMDHVKRASDEFLTTTNEHVLIRKRDLSAMKAIYFNYILDQA